jgi:restriction system protein
MKHYGCSKAIVVTTSFFTQEARELAKSNAVRLVDKDELKQLLLDNLHESWT